MYTTAPTPLTGQPPRPPRRPPTHRTGQSASRYHHQPRLLAPYWLLLSPTTPPRAVPTSAAGVPASFLQHTPVSTTSCMRRASPVAPPPTRPRRPPPLYCPPLPRAARLRRAVSSGRQIRPRRRQIQPWRAGYGCRRCPRHDPKPRRCAACPTCQSASSRRDGAQPWGVWPCCHHPGVPRGFRWRWWGNEGFAPGSSARGRRGGGGRLGHTYICSTRRWIIELLKAFLVNWKKMFRGLGNETLE